MSQEEIRYQFTADLSSLKQGVAQGISLLDKLLGKAGSLNSAKGSNGFALIGSNITGIKAGAKDIATVLGSMRVPVAFKNEFKELLLSVQSLRSGLKGMSAGDLKGAMGSTSAKSLSNALNYLLHAYAVLEKQDMRTTGAQNSVRNSFTEASKAIQAAQGILGTYKTVVTTTDTAATKSTSSTQKQSSAYHQLGSAARAAQVAQEQAARAANAATQSAQQNTAATEQNAQSKQRHTTATAQNAQAHKQQSKDVVTAKDVLNEDKETTVDYTTAVNYACSAVKALNDMFNSVAQGIVSLDKKLLSAISNTSLFSSAGSALSGALDAVADAVTFITGVGLGSIFENAIQSAVDYVETLELFRVATNGAYSSANNFVNIMEQLYGMDPNSIMQAYGMFSQLANAIDMPAHAASMLSQGLTKVALDMSSLYNVEFEDVITDLTAGMQGMVRATRKYGIDLRNTTLQQTANALGIAITARNTTEANRQGLRYVTILKQMQNVGGNFSSTIESVANQLRIFREQIAGVARAVGNLFMPALSGMIYKLVAVAMAIKTVLTFIGMLIGFIPQTFSNSTDTATDSVTNLTNAIGGAGGAASKTAKELKYLMGIDELNLIQPPDATGGGGGGGSALSDDLLDPALAAAIDSMTAKMEDYTMKAIKARDALMNFFGFSSKDGKTFYIEFDWDTQTWKTNIDWCATYFKHNLISKFPRWEKTIEAIFDTARDFAEAVVGLWDDIKEAIGLTIKPIQEFFDSVFTDEAVAKWVTDLPENIGWLGRTIKKWAPTVGEFVTTILELIHTVATSVNWKDLIDAITNLVEALGPAADAFGEGFSDAFGDITGATGKALTTIFQSIADTLNDADPEKLKSLGAFVANLLLLAPIAAPIVGVFTNVGSGLADIAQTLAIIQSTGGFSALFEGLSTAGAAAAPAIGSILGIAAAVIACIAAYAVVISQSDALKSGLVGAWEQIKQSLVTIWEGSLKPLFIGLWDILVQLWENVIAPILTILAGQGISILTYVSAAIGVLWIGVGALVRGLITLISIVAAVIGWFYNLVVAVFNVISVIAAFITALINGDWSTACKVMTEGMSAVWDTLKTDFTNTTDDMTKTWSDTWAGFGDVASTQWDKSMEAFEPKVTRETNPSRKGQGPLSSKADAQYAARVPDTVTKAMDDNRPKVRRAGEDAGTAVVEGMTASIDNNTMLAPAITTALTTTLSDTSYLDTIDIGGAVTDSITQSLDAGASGISAAITDPLQGIPSWAVTNVAAPLYRIFEEEFTRLHYDIFHLIIILQRDIIDIVLFINQWLNKIQTSITIHAKLVYDSGEYQPEGDGKEPPKGDPWKHVEPTIMASGGTVRSGQIFIANENGNPELIANFGSTTQVANNDQIEDAMYRAMTAALGQSRQVPVVLESTLKTSDRALAKATARGQTARGFTMVTKGDAI